MPTYRDLLEAIESISSGERDDLATAIFHHYTMNIIKLFKEIESNAQAH